MHISIPQNTASVTDGCRGNVVTIWVSELSVLISRM